MKLLVVGLGYVGRPLAAELAQRGHDVFGMRRSDGPVPDGVSVLRGDVLDGEVRARLPSDFDQVVVLLSAGERSEAAYERTYVGGASSVRHAFPGVRIVWVSSTAVYDAEGDALIDDATPASAESGTADILLRAEAAIQSGPHLIVRPSGIYGPERTTLLGRLTRGDIGPSEQGTWTNRIHRDDLVSILSFCVEQADLSGTLLASDQEPARLGDMQEWVQGKLGGGVPPAATAAALQGASSPPRPSASPRAPARAGARKSRRIAPSRLTALGFSWRYPSYQEGYGDILADGVNV